jgi:hypothetical protein
MLALSFEIARSLCCAAVEAAACFISGLTNVNARASEWQTIAPACTKNGALDFPFLSSLGLEPRYREHATIEESFLTSFIQTLGSKSEDH